MTPEARKDQLLAQDVGEEMVVYDERTFQAHRLNRTAAAVWRLANGRRSIVEIASLLREAIDAPEGEDLTQLSLEELDRAGLLVERLKLHTVGESLTRRRLLKVTAGLLPVVVSMATPTVYTQGIFTICALNPTFPGCPGTTIVLGSSSSSRPSSSPTSPSPSSSPTSTTPSSSPTSTTPTSSTTSAPTPSSSPSSGPNFPSFNGDYNMTATATENTCSFSQNAALQAALGLNANGQGTWRKVHVAAQVVFFFPNVAAFGALAGCITFTTSGPFNVGGTQYTVTDVFTFCSDGTVSGTQTFQGPNCRVVYNVTGRRA